MQVRLQDLRKSSTFIINDKACMMTGILKKEPSKSNNFMYDV